MGLGIKAFGVVVATMAAVFELGMVGARDNAERKCYTIGFVSCMVALAIMVFAM